MFPGAGNVKRRIFRVYSYDSISFLIFVYASLFLCLSVQRAVIAHKQENMPKTDKRKKNS